jgi:hypothetical protein
VRRIVLREGEGYQQKAGRRWLGVPSDGPSSVSGNVTHLQGGTGASRVPRTVRETDRDNCVIRARGCRPPAASPCSSDVRRHREGGSCHPRRL